MNIKHILKQCFTEPDNLTFCPIRIVAVLGILQYQGTELHNYIKHAVFDPQAFAMGFGALVAGVGAALALKKDTPKAGQ